jgi:hypothetical protein
MKTEMIWVFSDCFHPYTRANHPLVQRSMHVMAQLIIAHVPTLVPPSDELVCGIQGNFGHPLLE